jgi:hypothetical protein
MKSLLTALTCVSLVATISLRATPVTVQELGMVGGQYETVWIDSSSLGNVNVYAGPVNLLVDGTPTVGFCIDPWHWSASGALPYTLEPLANAPKSANYPATGATPNPMGASTALKIEQLWQQYYTPSLSVSPVTAAALQIEIWKLVDGAVGNGTFSLVSVDGGASASAAVYEALGEMDTFLGSADYEPAASLVAVTGPGQDYVIPGRVPDGGTTALLLGLAFAGLAAMRKKFMAC